jgi:hypothetical protein
MLESWVGWVKGAITSCETEFILRSPLVEASFLTFGTPTHFGTARCLLEHQRVTGT